MRANLDDNLARRLRQSSGTYGVSHKALSGACIIDASGPTVHVLDANGANRDVFLPVLHPGGGQYYFISNLSGVFSLVIKDSGGSTVVTLGPNGDALVFSSHLAWRYIVQAGGTFALIFTEPVITTSNSAVVGATDSGIVFNRVAPVTSTVTLPSVTVRSGLPVRIADMSIGIVSQHVITASPAGGENIMRQATLDIVSNGLALSGAMLWPSPTLLGWYMAP